MPLLKLSYRTVSLSDGAAFAWLCSEQVPQRTKDMFRHNLILYWLILLIYGSGMPVNAWASCRLQLHHATCHPHAAESPCTVVLVFVPSPFEVALASASACVSAKVVASSTMPRNSKVAQCMTSFPCSVWTVQECRQTSAVPGRSSVPKGHGTHSPYFPASHP